MARVARPLFVHFAQLRLAEGARHLLRHAGCPAAAKPSVDCTTASNACRAALLPCRRHGEGVVQGGAKRTAHKNGLYRFMGKRYKLYIFNSK